MAGYAVECCRDHPVADKPLFNGKRHHPKQDPPSNKRHSRTSRGHEVPLLPIEKRPWKGARGPRSWWRVGAGAGLGALLVVRRRRCRKRTVRCAWACSVSLRLLPPYCFFPEPRVLLPRGCGKRCCRSPRICGLWVWVVLIDGKTSKRHQNDVKGKGKGFEALMSYYTVTCIIVGSRLGAVLKGENNSPATTTATVERAGGIANAQVWIPRKHLSCPSR